DFKPVGAGPARKLRFVIGSGMGGGTGAGIANAQGDLSAVNAIDGDLKTAWSVGDFGTSSSNPFGAFQFAEPITTMPDSTLVIRLRQMSGTRRSTLGRFRLALSAGPAWPDDPLPGGTVEDITTDSDKEYLGLPARLTRALMSPEEQRVLQAQGIIETFF